MGACSSSKKPSLDQLAQDQNYRSAVQNVYRVHGNSMYPGRNLLPPTAHKQDISITSKTAIAIKNDFVLEKDLIILVQSPNDKRLHFLTFVFSSDTDVQISAYFSAKESVDHEGVTHHIDEKYPPQKVFVFGPVKHQHFPSYSIKFEETPTTRNDLTKIIDGRIPLIIKMETKTKQKNDPKKILYSYISFKPGKNQYIGQIIKQKLEFDGKSYILEDVFGIASSNITVNLNKEIKECAVCLTNPINTIILPCNHMCLCDECAIDLMERKTETCPMCRSPVQNFTILQGS